MPFDPRFHEVLPPLAETCSHRNWPCGEEGLPDNKCYCPDLFRPSPLDCLKRTYGPWLKVTLSEASTSIVVRSEHQYRLDEHSRFSRRKHFYELLSDSDGKVAAGGQGALICSEMHPDDRFGHYLGFVDLRPSSSGAQPTLAMAVLAPPRKYRHDPHTRLITGVYGPLFGGPAFASTIYSMQDKDRDGAVCIQSCLIMSLGMLADRGARLSGSFTLTCAAHFPYVSTGASEEQAGIPETFDTEDIQSVFPVRGLSAQETLRLLCLNEHRQFQVSPYLIRINRDVERKVVERLIEAFVMAKFPVILAVDQFEWRGGKAGSDSNLTRGVEGHAVVVVGMRQHPTDPEKVSLIIHDPQYAPFVERSVKACLRAGYAFQDNTGNDADRFAGRVHMMPIMEVSITQDPAVCVSHLLKYDNVWVNRQRARGTGQFASFVEFVQSPGKDLRIRLLSHCDLDAVLPPGTKLVNARKPLQCLKYASGRPLSPGRYWCFAGYANGELCTLWLFRAERRGDAARWLRVDFDENGKPSVHKTIVLRNAESSLIPIGQTRQPDDNTAKGDQGNKQLKISVLTSSTTKSISCLVDEALTVSSVRHFDVLLLREADIQELTARFGTKLTTPVEFLARDQNLAPIKRWLKDSLTKLKKAYDDEEGYFPVPAVATYIPQIVSLDPGKRDLGKRALINAIRVAQHLATNEFMENPIVEIVCGSKFDPFTANGSTRIIASDVVAKMDRLLSAITEVLQVTDATGERAYLALELEPGITYVLENAFALDVLKGMIDAKGKYWTLDGRVGLNVDIAHMRIADVRADVLERFKDLILHAHIADHPYVHTRDQAVGSWTHVEARPRDGYGPYISILRNCLTRNAGMPFTGSIAIELEGCDRMTWIHQSVSSLRHLLSLH